MNVAGMLDRFKAMLVAGKGASLFPAGNITNVKRGRSGWGTVTISIDNETADKIMKATMGGEPVVAFFMAASKGDFDNKETASDHVQNG
jgi:hypothetical protein